MLQRVRSKTYLLGDFNIANKILPNTYSTANAPQAKVLNTADCEEVRIQVPWGHIAGKWWGPKDRQPIFTFHGWQDNCGSFDRLIPLMPRHLSFLALDFPGHGHSSKIPPGHFYHTMNGPMLMRRLQAFFKLEKIALMGHSLGAITSYTFAGLFPKSIEYLICIDGLSPLINIKRLDRVTESIDAFLKYDAQLVSTLSGKSEPPTYTMEVIVEKLHEGTLQSIDKDKCKYILARNIKESKLKPGTFYFDRDPRLKSGPLMNWPLEDLEEHARRITFPLLCTMAEKSPVKRAHKHIKHMQEIIASVNPKAEFHQVKGTHHAHLNNPEVFVEIIPQFIAKHDTTNTFDSQIFEKIKYS